MSTHCILLLEPTLLACDSARASASDKGCVIPGKFYTLATGANERRWGKMKPRLEQVVESFEVSTRYDAVG